MLQGNLIIQSSGPEFIDVVEIGGEFVRHMATVEIIDTDRKYNLPLTICSRMLFNNALPN